MFDIDVPTPDEWNDFENPPYSYYLYYMFANITVLNHFREVKGDVLLELIKQDLLRGSPMTSTVKIFDNGYTL